MAPSLRRKSGVSTSILVCGLGYAEGAALSRRLGGWQVISWALLLSLPVMLVVGLSNLPETWRGIGQYRGPPQPLGFSDYAEPPRAAR